MQIWTQNKKMRVSSQNGIDVRNFGIPAFQSNTGFKTCPNAKQCATGCYAKMGAYIWNKVSQAYHKRLELTQSDTFDTTMIYDTSKCIDKSRRNSRQCIFRVHDSGDFYNLKYIHKWFNVMRHFETLPDVKFYAYTKMVQLFKQLRDSDSFPDNFTIIYSFGGQEDSHIDTSVDRHAKVFQNETDLLDAGYVDASQDDMVAALGANHKIGLVYHGVKKFANTTWSSVS